ncbi:MAG: biotin--[acetyl-CoA-carboxylase] ligase [Pseudomonadota bacterium]
MTPWPTGARGEIHDSIDSTNAAAAQRIAEGETGPYWIAARAQTTGRGRQGRTWQSPKGNLFATLITPHAGSPATAALTGFAAALAVADTLVHFAPSATIGLKWPNDVLLNDAKASGILLESFAGDPLTLAIGIGLNLAEAPPPDQTRWRATSLAAETGTPPPFDAALGQLAHNLTDWLTTLQTQGFDTIREAWLARAAHLGQPIEVHLSDRHLTGRFADLDADGTLVLDSGARQHRIAAGDVFLPGVG